MINRVIQQAAENFSDSLSAFYPSYGRNGINERNLTFQLANAFGARNGAHAFMEVPFLNPLTQRYENRIDCMLFDKERVFFVEAKRLFRLEKAEQLRNDFQRMNAETLAPILKKFVSPTTRTRSVYRLMLAETWHSNIVNWWQKEDTARGWDHSWLPDNSGVVEVKTFDNQKKLHWLYAYEQLEMPD
ncbi:hypothetical protein J4P02_11065 [Pseudomonas sp. NFXW11]|uniref:hypothetical protein n=1 Tax=Pseudomonas sp. NFXW11 TaxID=2819531 RepID=UPI003CFAFA89